MNPLRKPFRLDPVFPFELVYRQTRSAHNELSHHLHDLCEIVYIHEGQGSFFIDNAFYRKKAGDVYLIPGNTIHRAIPDTDDPIVSTALFFSPLLLQNDNLDDGFLSLMSFDKARKKQHYRLELASETSERFNALLETIHHELETKQLGYRQAARCYLQQLLILLGRLLDTADKQPKNSHFGPKWLVDALQSIEQAPATAGGLEQLSKAANVSPSHFARTFKQLTGTTLLEYIAAKRIVLSKQMLIESDDNIASIALNSGFPSLPHFYQTFKRLTGETPKSYRDMNKG